MNTSSISSRSRPWRLALCRCHFRIRLSSVHTAPPPFSSTGPTASSTEAAMAGRRLFSTTLPITSSNGGSGNGRHSSRSRPPASGGKSVMEQELEELMQVDIDERVQEFRRLQQHSHTDPLYRAYRREIDELRDSTWSQYHSKGVQFSEQNIDYMKSRLAQEMEKVDAKYRRLYRMQNREEEQQQQQREEDNENHHQRQQQQHPQPITEQDRRDAEELHRILKRDKDSMAQMHDDPVLRSFRDLVKTQLGYDLPTDDSHFTPQELLRTKQFLQSEESRSVLKHFENVLSDGALKNVGIDMEDMIRSMEKEGQTAEAPPSSTGKAKGKTGTDSEETDSDILLNDRVWQVKGEPQEEPPTRHKAQGKAQVQQEKTHSESSPPPSSTSSETEIEFMSEAYQELKKDGLPLGGDKDGEGKDGPSVSPDEVLAAKMFNPVAMDNLRHMMQKEALQNPEIAQMMKQQFGVSLDEMMDEFEKNMQSGMALQGLDDNVIEEGLKRAKEMAERKTVKRD